MIKIVIIDGQEAYRESLKPLLSAQQDFEVAGVGKDGYDAIRLVDSLKPDIALLDIKLDLIDGVKVSSILKCRSVSTAIIILTDVDDTRYVLGAICNGVSGYLLKNSGIEILARAIRAAYKGGCLLTPEIAAKTFRIFSEFFQAFPKELAAFPKETAAFSQTATAQRTTKQLYRLQEASEPLPLNISKMELQIMNYIGQGLPNKEIAERLRLREGTVRNYISSVLQKTGLHDRTQVALYAVKAGLGLNSGAAFNASPVFK
jgi:DNA-binding NarL/FixJ family response regulator